MNKFNLGQMKRYNKATAAVLSQTVVQLIAAFVRFPPELEQAIGIVMTSVMVYLVPNQGDTQGHEFGSPRNREPLVAHLPFPAALAAIGVTLLLAGCAGVVSGASVADRLLGPDCGPGSRVFRANSLVDALGRAYPSLETVGMRLSVAMMESAASGGQSLEQPAAVFQDALIMAMAPIVLEAGREGEPVWLSLAYLPGIAGELVFVRRQMAEFCANA